MSTTQEIYRELKYEDLSPYSSSEKRYPLYFEEFCNPYLLPDDIENYQVEDCANDEDECSISSTEWSSMNRGGNDVKHSWPATFQGIFSSKKEQIDEDYDTDDLEVSNEDEPLSEGMEIADRLDSHFSCYVPFEITDKPTPNKTATSTHKRKIETSLIPLSDLEKCYKYLQVDASKKLGVNISILKKSCKKHGIHRWPHRRIAGIERRISQVEASLFNLTKMKKLDQDQIVLNALRDRLAALEEVRRKICEEARRPKSFSTEPSTDIQRLNEVEIAESQNICLEDTGNSDDSGNKLSGSESEDAQSQNYLEDETSEFLAPIITNSEYFERSMKQRLRHKALQERFDVSSPFLQLQLIHSYAKSMIEEKSHSKFDREYTS